MYRRIAVLAVLLLYSFVPLAAQSDEITAEELRDHVRYLASDELEGRAAGTTGNTKAAEYIADRFRTYGLRPAGDGDSYFQSFDFVSAVKLGDRNSLAFTVKGQPLSTTSGETGLLADRDFRPLGFSTTETVSAPVAFAGYGISAPDKNYDDYANIDVNGKVVIVLRYAPDGNDPHGEFVQHTSFRNKARTAREKGAKGLIVVSGPADGADDELVKLAFDHAYATSGIPALSMRRSTVEPLFAAAGRDLRSVQDSIKANKQPIAFDFAHVEVTLSTEVEKILSRTANIAGYLEGVNSELQREVLVIGAHMDHLGYGGPGSGSLQPDTTAIHNGADDNASGVAALLEIAQAFASRRAELKRTVLFLSFSAEEIGTLGSAHYVNNPFFPLDRTVAMINMDMIGRLENNTLTVYGTGTSSVWDTLVGKHNTMAHASSDEGPAGLFTIKPVADGVGPSDHSQFYMKDIPVLFFFTGTHSDYHKPSDDWEKINYDGEAKVSRFVNSIALDLASGHQRPLFVRTPTTASMMGGGDTRGFSVTLGIIPDYGGSDEGMKIGGTRPNGPAEKAGMLSGDIIVKMAGKKILNIYDYMAVLGELEEGQEVEIEAIRKGELRKFTATMQKRK